MFKVEQLMNTGDYQSGRCTYVIDWDSDDYVDIDTPADFVTAQMLIQKHCDKYNLLELLFDTKKDKTSEKDEDADLIPQSSALIK